MAMKNITKARPALMAKNQRSKIPYSTILKSTQFIQHGLSPTRVGEGIPYTLRIRHKRNEREINVMEWRQPMIIRGGIIRERIMSS